jgi:hypothetical protein
MSARPDSDIGDVDHDERAAIQAEPTLPPPGTPEHARIDAEHRVVVAGLLAGYRRARSDAA